LGISKKHIRLIAVDDARRIRLDALAQQIRDDVVHGLWPTAVCASAGTANTGTIDPLEAVADLCTDLAVELGLGLRLWFHIDGAYGAPAVITDEYAWMARAFCRADSLSLDPHKWLFAPIDVGCLLLRDEAIAKATFSWDSEYTKVIETDPIEKYAFFDHGLEMTRRFRGLKVWSILKARGAAGLRAAIAGNIRVRAHLDARVAAEPRLESLGSDLSISCFRYQPATECSPSALNQLNQTILETIVAEGNAFMSPTTLDGRYALRICIVNFRTREQDVDFLLDEVLRVGALADGLRTAPAAG
jgi:glutamate/tyrosine decarboxylase-like PLP-dependent enzyme